MKLDGLGNWRRFITDPVGDDPTTQIRQHNGLNQITSTQDEGEAKIGFTYDAPRAPYTAAAQAMQPFALWRLNETGGTTAEDLVGNNDGTYTNGYTLGQEGLIPSEPNASSVAFNGSTGRVNVGTLGNFGSQIGANDGASIAAWVQTTNSATQQGVFGGTSGAGLMSMTLQLNHTGPGTAPGRVRLMIRDNSNVSLAAHTSVDAGVADGRPHLIVATVRPSTKTIAIYVDGQAMPMTYTALGTLTNYGNFSRDLQIAAVNQSAGVTQFLHGNVENVALFTRVLSAQEAQTLYQAGAQVHGGNGNLTDDGVRLYAWDALNRLKQVQRKSDGEVIAEYVYDALGRRIRKTVSNGGLSENIPDGATDCIYNTAWQCVEERDGGDDPLKQYVWGTYIDELLQLKTFAEINGNAAGEYYPLQDLLYRTVALLNAEGEIVETYDCDAYGNTLIFTAPGTGGNWWADDAIQSEYPTCDRIFTGQQFDTETRLYHFRNRPYDPATGRFPNRDPIGYNGGMNFYGAYFVPSSVDPLGLISIYSASGIDDATDVISSDVKAYVERQKIRTSHTLVIEEVKSNLKN